jgi:adenylate cyclase, class 2
MAKNLEIKAFCTDLEKTEPIVKKIATMFLGLDSQTDTYFYTKNGRFKLRESSISGSYLIPYLRPNQTNAKLSMYAKIDIQDTANVKSLFEQLLGIECIVKKKRSIYLYENIRIHLDEVDELGSFIEFEAVLDEINSDEKKEQEKVNFLLRKLKVGNEDLIAASYENLLKDKIAKNELNRNCTL